MILSAGFSVTANDMWAGAADHPDLDDLELVVLRVSKDEGAEYRTVQEAIDAAPPAAVVRVGAGVFQETLRIDKPLVLEGAGWQKTTIQAPPALPESTLKKAWDEFDQEYRQAKTEDEKGALRRAFFESVGRPALWLRDASGVTIRGVKFTASVRHNITNWLPGALVLVRRAELQMVDCALLGSPRSGIWIVDGSEVEIRRSLIAAVWGTGIVIGERKEGKNVRVAVTDCDVRNCHYAGITISRGNEAVIRRCRVSGAAWHGIRYDDCSPTIEGNFIFGNARCGIYASGKTGGTVKGNLFTHSEGTGMSCWFRNSDTIAENTFANNQAAGLTVSGASEPKVQRNIFFGHPQAIICSSIADDKPSAHPVGNPLLRANMFWQNDMNLVRAAREKDAAGKRVYEEVELGKETATILADPGFADAATARFALTDDAPARREAIGVADPLSPQSPWPLQPEEKAIIPDGPTRNSRQWKDAK